MNKAQICHVDNPDRKKKPPRRKPSSWTFDRHNRTDSAAAPNEENDEDDSYLVSCRCESAKAVATLLSCLKRIAVGSDAERESYAMTAQRSGSNNRPNTNAALTQRYRRRTVGSTLQPVTVYCSPTGLTFHVYGKSKQMQASVDIPRQLFSDYSVASSEGHNDTSGSTGSTGTTEADDWRAQAQAQIEGGEFCVNLTTVMECLYSLGTHNLDQTKLCFSYNITKETFKIELLEESGVLSTAAIPGLVPPDDESSSLALAFRSSPVIARLIVQSDPLQDLVSELEHVAGGTLATVALTSDQGLSMSVVGYLGECQVVLPCRGSHVVSVEFPTDDNVTARDRGRSSATDAHPTVATRTYPLQALTESMRGLDIAHETCLTMNAMGMMAIQHQVFDNRLQADENNTPSFIDFILCCMYDTDDDDTEGGTDTAASSQSTTGTPCATSPPMAPSTTTATARIVSQNKVYYDSDEYISRTHHDHHSAPDESLTDIYAPAINANGTTTAIALDESTAQSNHTSSTAMVGLFGSIVATEAGCKNQTLSPNFLDAVSSRATLARKRRFGRRGITQVATASRGDSTLSSQGGDTPVANDTDEEVDTLDITAPATPPRRRRRRQRQPKDGTTRGNRFDDSPPSSPELVYGSQE